MNWRESGARIVLMIILVVLPIVLLGEVRTKLSSFRIINITASIAENGGFQPDSISVQEGEIVTLRFRSADSVHGVALGPALGVDLGNINPGQVKELTLVFDKAGTYTFYCNLWCSPKHWRMRGSIQVYSTDNTLPVPFRDPVIDTLAAEGVDIDAMHNASATAHDSMVTIYEIPSVTRGAALAKMLSVPGELNNAVWRQSHTPFEGLNLLSQANAKVGQSDLVDVVAYLWTERASPDSFDAGTYYAKNCASCHGDTGNGKGFMAGLTAKEPANFADPNHMFIVRDDVLYAKIRRGGMGTDMPNFGTILTPEETWQIVRYLRKFSTMPNALNYF
jgi:mono/diheme cytochrome c family protein/plastocyanin